MERLYQGFNRPEFDSTKDPHWKSFIRDVPFRKQLQASKTRLAEKNCVSSPDRKIVLVCYRFLTKYCKVSTNVDVETLFAESTYVHIPKETVREGAKYVYLLCSGLEKAFGDIDNQMSHLSLDTPKWNALAKTLKRSSHCQMKKQNF